MNMAPGTGPGDGLLRTTGDTISIVLGSFPNKENCKVIFTSQQIPVKP
jgi:hypothetical protein